MGSDSMAKFRPVDYQAPLPADQLILKDQPETDETVPMDVIFVGGGPAGLAGAIELSKLIQKDNESGEGLGDIEIGVLEKSPDWGGHNLSGAVINPVAFKELFPEKKIEDFPFKRPVQGEDVFFMTETGHFKIPTPPTMKNHGNYCMSISEACRWLANEAEGLGVNLFPAFPADSLLVEGDRVVGVRTTPAGLNKDGSEGDQYMPPTDLRAQVTVLSEGTRGTLSQAYQEWQGIASTSPQIYALGVKEVWRVKNMPKNIVHTMGWPLPKDAFGGSWMYPMGDDTISLGLVAGLDYKSTKMDVHYTFQRMKDHPLFKQYLEGGECIEWGAKTIPEGGYHSLPKRFSGDGMLMLGDSLGLVNVPALKGIHYAMMSGIYAARAIFKALKAKDTSGKVLAQYDQDLKNSFVVKDLYKVRNMRQAFKDGFYMGGFKAGLMTLTGGAFPGGSGHDHADEEELKDPKGPATPVYGTSKVDGVYMSANKTRDDIPSHLTVGSDIPKEVAEMYVSMCPAGVYEMDGEQLIVNSPNCIDCKATDVLGPRWRPREGGSGPNYTEM